MFQSATEPADVDVAKRSGQDVFDIQAIVSASVSSGRDGWATKAGCVAMVTDSGTLHV